MIKQSVQRWERTVLYLLVLALALLLGFIQWNLYQTRTPQPVELEPLIIGMSLKEFSSIPFATVTGETIILDDYFDQSGLLIFLHSECPYCQRDIPLWNLLAQETKMLGVANVEDVAGSATFSQKYNLSFPILVDADGLLFSSLDIFFTPTKIAISSDLRVLQIWEGHTTRQSGQAEIGSLLTMYGIEPTLLPQVDLNSESP